MNMQTQVAPVNGAVVEISLAKLKKSPRNARRRGHAEADIETLAASIAAKGLLQPLVVEPEIGEDGAATGGFFVTIGEGRRLAHKLLAKRGQIGKGHRVRCIVDTANDPFEISLDENITRFAMHPADQFEAFRRLADERGWSAEEIAARFGVTAQLVRQRLKLANVSPRLMAFYRSGELTLDQLMAFAITDDHARQEGVLARLSWNREPYTIRRLLTEDRVSSRDKRAIFVGVKAYEAAGGIVERDLFAEDGGGYFVDAELLDRLALAKLESAAEAERQAGWAWVEVSLDCPSAHGLRRLYPKERPLTDEAKARMTEAAEAYDALHVQWDDVDEVPAEVMEELDRLGGVIDELAEGRFDYDPDDRATSGVFVVLAHDGCVRCERGFVRPQDDPPTDPDAPEPVAAAPSEPRRDPGLPDRLVADLTAHRTAALRDRLAQQPLMAMLAITHALTLQTFYFGHDLGSCLELRVHQLGLAAHVQGYEESIAGQAIEARHAAFAARLPEEPASLWEALLDWSEEDRLALLAHCVSLSLNAVRLFEQRPRALAHAETLASALGLDMRAYWRATEEGYFGRITKRLILQAVSEARSAEEAGRITALKKGDMAAEAERLIADSGWLPPPLRPFPEPTREP